MRPLPAAVLTCLLALAAPVVAPAAPAAVPAQAEAAQAQRGQGDQRDDRDQDRPTGFVQGTRKPQTSDGVVGPAPREVAPSLRGSARRAPVTTPVVPGVDVTTWDEATSRGPVHLSLLSVRWGTPGLSIDQVNSGPVAAVDTVSRMVARDGGVAGVNADFFDIGDTGAPLGVGRDRQRGLLHGRLDSWNSAFYVDRTGTPQIGPLPTVVRIKQRPQLRVDGFNSPSVLPGRIAAWTPAWGRTSGYRWTDGQRKRVRIVQVVKNKVKWTGTRLPRGTRFRGTLLVGRDAGAAQLRQFKRGMRLKLERRVPGQPQMAVTGNKFLLLDGTVTVVDDREMHPRTAVGIDRDTGTLLFLAVDGRSKASRGYTMVELAQKMIDLGAESALNLDGGGSTTMVARRPGSANLGVVNVPSDGAQRRVANGVSIQYSPR